MSTFDFEAFNQAYEQINHYERLQNIQRTMHAPGKITVLLDITEQHLSSPGTAHGGSMSGFMDVVLGYAALTKALPEGNVVSTVEFKMNFLSLYFLEINYEGREKYKCRKTNYCHRRPSVSQRRTSRHRSRRI